MQEKDGMRNVYTIGVVSFFTDVSTEIVLGLFPAFILALPGSSTAILDLIEGTAYDIYYLTVRTAFFAANSIVGGLWQAFGPLAASAYIAASTTLAIISMLAFLRSTKS